MHRLHRARAVTRGRNIEAVATDRQGRQRKRLGELVIRGAQRCRSSDRPAGIQVYHRAHQRGPANAGSDRDRDFRTGAVDVVKGQP